jgi:hypothetical protein
VYYDSYWESLRFTPAERDAWRAAFPPDGPDGFEIAPRAARRWADAGFSPEGARSTFEAAGVDHVAARRWTWADPPGALAWMAAGFGPEDGKDWALSFPPDEAAAWRAAGFGPAEAGEWEHLMGRDGIERARAWAAAGFDPDEAGRAIAEGVPLEVAKLQRAGPDAPLGRGNGGQRRSR